MAVDFMPLDGRDYVELRCGNAKQAAYFYGNFKALFEAIEREQALRGNL